MSQVSLVSQQEASLPSNLIGVASNTGMYRGDKKGYGLVVTRHAIIGAVKPESSPNFEAYLGPDSTIDNSVRREAEMIAASMSATKDFEISVGAVGQVLFRAPGLFEGGHFIIKSPFDVFKVETSVLYVDPELVRASKALADSFSAVLGWRFTHGRTGESVIMSR